MNVKKVPLGPKSAPKNTAIFVAMESNMLTNMWICVTTLKPFLLERTKLILSTIIYTSLEYASW